ncbi:MAG: phosphopyruvate hydratase [Anaerolinea sp.]|nr:phosphopyruvate hydratase [Anaerolinea sp.]
MPVIQHLDALEILDSRGRPTLQVTCTLNSGAVGAASVPSGASTGRAEAHELRDGDPSRYRGLGCRKAVANVRGAIFEALRGVDLPAQAALDNALIALDGHPNKANLGANALLGVSLAFARACAVEAGQPLYDYLAGSKARTLPRLTINLFSGGKHAGGQVAVQDVLMVPLAATIEQSLADAFAVYQAAADLILSKYGMRALTADEGGLAPNFPDDETMLQDAVRAIEAAGFTPGQEVALAVDVASSHFYADGVYRIGGQVLPGDDMIAHLLRWSERYPLVSIEDGLAEEDWAHWSALREQLPPTTRALGDDLLCTNPDRIRRAIDRNAANALLLKVNQIGTLTEAAASRALAEAAGWQVVVSARSGETEDNWLADLAVGWGGDYIKVGSITQSERLAKYNRLLMIERETGLPIKG